MAFKNLIQERTASLTPPQTSTPQAAQFRANPKKPEGVATTYDRLPSETATCLSPENEETLCALAALQIRYGKPHEAIPFLMMVRRENAENREALRLLAAALIKLEKWDEAEQILRDLNLLSTTDKITLRMASLYQSIVALRTSRLEDARIWFKRFRDITMGASS